VGVIHISVVPSPLSYVIDTLKATESILKGIFFLKKKGKKGKKKKKRPETVLKYL